MAEPSGQTAAEKVRAAALAAAAVRAAAYEVAQQVAQERQAPAPPAETGGA